MACDDSQILGQLRRGDPDAVRAAVQSHGPMVYNVCRRVLADPALAEDAAQAVFILLLKKHKSLDTRAALGPWLYRAAEFVARNALRARRRRIKHERAAAAMSKPDSTEGTEDAWADIRPDLDRAMAELPERLRAPIVLVHLQGRPGAEAARLLGLPQRTFYDRLAKGLDRLRRRLSPQALSLSPAALGAVLSNHGAEMAVPAALKAITSGAASGALAGSAAIQLVLKEAVMSTVFWSKTQTAAVVTLAIVLSVAVTAPVTMHVARSRPPRGTATDSTTELARLQVAMAALQQENQTLRKALIAGDVAPQETPAAAAAATDADADLAQLLDDMPWDAIGSAIVNDAREHSGASGTSAELVSALLPHLPKLLKLQKALGAASIEELFDHDLVQACVIPIYARELAGVRLTAAQTDEVAAIMRHVQAVRQELEQTELPVYDFLAAAAEAKQRLRAVLGEEAMDKLSAADLLGVTPPPRMQTTVSVDGRDRPAAEHASEIAARWIRQYQLDPSAEMSLVAISAELADAVNSYPMQSSALSFGDDPTQAVAPALLDAHRQATSRILREVPLTEEQQQRVRHSLILHIKAAPPPDGGP